MKHEVWTAELSIARAIVLLDRDEAIVKPEVLLLHVGDIKSKAIGYFLSYPSRCRLPNMKRDLNVEELRQMAVFDAAIEVANHLGLLDKSRLAELMPTYYTASSK